MCLEDVKIGRLTRGQLTNVGLTTTRKILIGSDRHRRVLGIFPDASTAFRIYFTNGSGAPLLSIPSGTQPIFLTVDKHGDFVTRSLFADVAAGSLTVAVYAASFNAEELE